MNAQLATFTWCVSSFALSQEVILSWGGVVPPPTTFLERPIQFELDDARKTDVLSVAESNTQLTIKNVPHKETQTEVLVLSTNL
ncbi:hypothetical protein VP758_001580 [Vibrio harveyi]|nr:hypothetical protein [Vibrio harveyi]